MGAIVGLQRLTVEPHLQIAAGVGIRQNFGVGEGVNICDNLACPRFDEAAGAGFAGGILVFDGDGHGLALVLGAGGALGAPPIGEGVACEVKR
jgi:hypothetical protein